MQGTKGSLWFVVNKFMLNAAIHGENDLGEMPYRYVLRDIQYTCTMLPETAAMHSNTVNNGNLKFKPKKQKEENHQN